MIEVWREIEGANGFLVSNLGRIKNNCSVENNQYFGKIRSGKKHKCDYLYKKGMKQNYLANRYGIKQPTVSEIVNNKKWTHV